MINLQHACDLNIDQIPGHLRKTGIICTIGPASRDVSILIEMIKAGMNVARLNFSHGDHEYHKGTINNIRAAIDSFKPKVPVAIALDIKGPKIRTGILEPNIQEITLVEGKILRLTIDKHYAKAGNENILYVDYPKLVESLSVGNKIYIDDGIISVIVKSKGNDFLDCQIENGGKIGSFKGINLPGVFVDLPAISEKDYNDIRFGVANNVDIIFASFMRDAAGVKEVRKALGDDGKSTLVIAKVESYQGLKNINEIIKESDGVMVARGDMGIEIEPEKVFLAQKMIIARCNVAGKACICATQMLESMLINPRPTRAEVSDVGNAVVDGADCTMLSGETAKGKYPVGAIQIMSKISLEAESTLCHKHILQNLLDILPSAVDPTEAIAISAVEASIKCNAKAIITLTQTGKTATLISKYRPKCMIVAVSRSWKICAQLHVYRGVRSVFCDSQPLPDWLADVDQRVKLGIDSGKLTKLVNKGDTIILATGWREGPGHTNTIRIVTVD